MISNEKPVPHQDLGLCGFSLMLYSVEECFTQIYRGAREGELVLPIMAYTRSLRPKGVPFSGFRYIKG